MGLRLHGKEEKLLRRYVTRLDDMETSEPARVVVPVKARRRRPVDALAVAEGVVIVSLLSWLVGGYNVLPSVRAWLDGSILGAGVSWVPVIMSLSVGVLIGGTLAYVVEHRHSREQRILENLLGLIE